MHLPARFCLLQFFNGLQDHNPRLDKTAELRAAHRGCVVKLMGDGLRCEFASVVDAVAVSVKCGCEGRFSR